MSERGVTEHEVKDAVEGDLLFPAWQGRRRHRKISLLDRYWLSKYYRCKMVDVYSVEEGDVVIVLTVVAKYF